MGRLNVKPRTVFCRDNLDILQGINSACIDLIYLDPPFNKKKVFTAPIGSSAEGAEFSDIFREEDVKDEWVSSIQYENHELYSYLLGVKEFSNKYNYCYLVYMAIRLLECCRILKDSGSVYLHCDPTMSHYLKIVMDCIFDEKNFRNEIVWHYQTGGAGKKWYVKKHDIILFYSKTNNYFFNAEKIKVPRTAEVLRRIQSGVAGATRATDSTKLPMDVFTDINALNAMDKERTGYPTQKPLALLERIIQGASRKGDMVLDPFCGCATTCIAAEKSARQWIGIDVSHKAYELVQERIKKEIEHPLLDELFYSTIPPLRDGDERVEKGYVYVISNAAWQGKYKVGIAKDVNKRLNSYQTSDPMRGYKLEYRQLAVNFKQVEITIHKTFNSDYEWVSAELKAIIAKIKEISE